MTSWLVALWRAFFFFSFEGKFDILEICLLDFWQTRDERIDIAVRPVECKAAVYFVGA